MSLVKEIDVNLHSDARGSFVKYFSISKVGFIVSEIFASSTKKGFVRGIHLQVEKAESSRIVLNWKGKVFTVFLDLRKDSKTLGKYETFTTDNNYPRCFLVPPGVAHGFQALSDCDVLYASSQEHAPALDTGVHPLSLPLCWPMEIKGLSPRDSNLPSLEDYLSSIRRN
jgi:dTDP-4-dehydrorhamnose 3,5-epimerase